MEAAHDQPKPSGPSTPETGPDFGRPVRPIAELVVSLEFPRCALGEHVDIGGYIGVVTGIVNQSLKVRSPEGRTKSFNAGGLRRIYSPPVAAPLAPGPPPSSEGPAPAPPPPLEPDFSKPIKPICQFAGRPDYPNCLLGEHIDIAGFTGVVVQIVNRSLKIRTSAEITRSYSADALRRLHAPG
jgi:hypothetical protein